MRSPQPLLALLLVTSCSRPTPSDPPPESADRAVAEHAKAQAKELVECFVTGDYRRMAEKTLPVVVDRMGGANAMAKRIEDGMKNGPAITAIEVGDAALHRRPPMIYAFVPFTMKVGGLIGTRAKNSHLLGVSSDGGTVWHFVDCAGLSADTVKRVLPDFPADLPLPAAR